MQFEDDTQAFKLATLTQSLHIDILSYLQLIIKDTKKMEES